MIFFINFSVYIYINNPSSFYFNQLNLSIQSKQYSQCIDPSSQNLVSKIEGQKTNADIMNMFNTQLIIQLMKLNDKSSIVLPNINHKKTTVKSLLKSLKEKRIELEEKANRSNEDQQINPISEQNSIKNSRIKQRLITQIPWYLNMKKPKGRSIEESIFSQHRRTRTQQSLSKGFQSRKSQNQKQLPVVEDVIVEIQEKNQFQLFDIYQRIPKQLRKRTEQNTSQIKHYIVKNNMFFIKINSIITSCLIKVAKFHIVTKGKLIYKYHEHPSSFFIMIGGKVRLINPQLGLKKVCVPGQTFGEQFLFQESHHRKYLQTAKATKKSYLMQLTSDNYKKVQEEMLKFGYKNQFYEAQSLIKRNFIAKNMLRRQFYKQLAHKIK